MARLIIPYLPIVQPATSLHPDGRTAYRPFVRLKLVAPNGRFFEGAGLADSGADACLFPLRFAKYLKLDLSSAPTGLTTGVGSTVNLTYYAQISVEFGPGLRFESQIGFTEGMDRAGFGLLGQQGFFENYNVDFRHRQRQFTIESA